MVGVSSVDKVALALVVLVLASGCMMPASDTPESSTTSVTTTTAPTASTTTTPATTTAPTTSPPATTRGSDDAVITSTRLTEKRHNGTHVEIETGVVQNESLEEFGVEEVPAKYVSIWISAPTVGNATYAVATNCTGYRDSIDLGPGVDSWDILTNESHNITEWDFVQVARVDTGEVIARHDLVSTDHECSPPLPKPQD